jgi:8-oxo-dGTP pyrophosphatase MutT (NUDIX family)
MTERLAVEAARDGIDELVAGAVVHDDGRVLILRRSATDAFLPGIEELPSGGVEDGEDILTALARELTEEIGWTGPLTPDPGFVSSFDYVSGSGRRTRQYTFAVPYAGHEIRLSEEHTAYRWIGPADLTASGLTPETVRTIRDWTG